MIEKLRQPNSKLHVVYHGTAHMYVTSAPGDENSDLYLILMIYPAVHERMNRSLKLRHSARIPTVAFQLSTSRHKY